MVQMKRGRRDEWTQVGRDRAGLHSKALLCSRSNEALSAAQKLTRTSVATRNKERSAMMGQRSRRRGSHVRQAQASKNQASSELAHDSNATLAARPRLDSGPSSVRGFSTDAQRHALAGMGGEGQCGVERGRRIQLQGT